MSKQQLSKEEILDWLERVTEKMRASLDLSNVNELKSELRYELSRIEQLIDAHKESDRD